MTVKAKPVRVVKISSKRRRSSRLRRRLGLDLEVHDPQGLQVAHPNHPVGEAAHPGRLQTGGAGTRIECRIPDADRNPYLACATTLAAGLHGIDNELELPKVFEGNMYAAKRVPDMPKTLREALAACKKSKALRAAFGDPVVDHDLHAGE